MGNGEKLGFLERFLALWVSLAVISGVGGGYIYPATTYAGNQDKKAFPPGVCPPFYLKDESGNIIDPVHNINADKPYSPKQTCGTCHDYNKITEGFHFTQGKGEKVPEWMAKRYNWVSSPGNYGGTWCSPAPLYRQLAPKKNNNPRMIDMTSFEFVTATCGYCHPGGGPLEYDRDGNRYDEYMKKTGMKSGGDNGFDGDYYKARWIETGVIEADCLLCHMPEYNFKERNKQIDNLNFKWAATAGAGIAKVEGSVKEGKPVEVIYDESKFNNDGTISFHIAKEPRNTACLNCHAKPGWKKRGASFSPRTDVHIRAGLKCVDCHSAGSNAIDKRIKGKEVHQIGKGDDPSGHVRDDLDNTMLDCEYCHTTGYLGAPIPKHERLPLLHCEKIACQTCHIPLRYVKSAQVQVSDVFNRGPKISPPSKRIWTFYDQNMNYWNHYGELATFTTADQPTTPFRPVLIRYKGKIYPANRVHSAWPGIIEEGKPGLNQPFMKDIFTMWQVHNENPEKYPELSKIVDDNGDGVPEVNKPEEIDAIINSVTQYLKNTGFDLANKKVVWVYDDRVYFSGNKWEPLPKYDYEASPYASVYKYSHDVAPAKSALGAKGCSDCHSKNSPFFFAEVVKYPFGEDGKPVTISSGRLIGCPSWVFALTQFRLCLTPYVSIIIPLLVFALVLHYTGQGPKVADFYDAPATIEWFSLTERWVHLFRLVSFLILAFTGYIFFYNNVTLLKMSFGSPKTAVVVHWVAGIVFAVASVMSLKLWAPYARFAPYDKEWLAKKGGYIGGKEVEVPAGRMNAGQKIFFWFTTVLSAIMVVTGVPLIFKSSLPLSLSCLLSTIHGFFAVVFFASVIAHAYLGTIANPGTWRILVDGKVSKAWIKKHHSVWYREHIEKGEGGTEGKSS